MYYILKEEIKMLIVKIWLIILFITIVLSVSLDAYLKASPLECRKLIYSDKVPIVFKIVIILIAISILGGLYTLIYFLFIR